MATTAVLALDVGGTTVKGAVVDETGRAVHRLVRRSFPSDGASVLAVVSRTLEELAGHGRDAGLHVVGAAVVTPGLVDDDTGRVGYAANLGWRDLDLRGRLEPRLGLPVAVGHDVRAAGTAEALLGAGHGTGDLVFIAVGTGIAAALVTGGHLVTGVGAAAGEIGHMPVHPGGRRCGCGQLGCMEAYASGASIARRYGELAGVEGATAERVAAVLGDDPVADRVWAEAVEALALGCSTVTMMLDPELVVLGGGLARAGDRLLGPLRGALADLLTWRRPPELAASVLGAAAGQVGAAMLAFRATGRGGVVESWTAGDVLAAG